MGFLDDLKKGKKDEEVKSREVGKTYREGELKRSFSIRKTSVSSKTFTFTKALLSVVTVAVAVSVVGYIGYYFFSLAMNW